MFYKKCGLVTFSGAMAQSDFSGEINPYTEKSFEDTLSGKTEIIYPKTENLSKIDTVKGLLFGGNLSTLASLCGTNFIPDEKFIFFTEDINEPAYKIDRYFTQLLNIPEFRNNIQAVIYGDFTGVDKPEYLKDLLNEIQDELNIPVAGNYPVSHSPVKATIPVGGYGEFDGTKLKISDYILEN